MIHPETHQCEQYVANYLQVVQALRSEMTVAMDCIAENALPRFQESVARQEALCAELEAVDRKLKRPSPGRSCLASLEPALASRLREAGALLRQTNMAYAALLRHSGRTLSLLTSLCNMRTGNLQEARGSRSKFQTWSCEM